MRQSIGSALVQVMACRLVSATPMTPLPSNQCWLIVNWTLQNKLQWNSNQIKIQNFSFMKMHLKMSSAKWQPFCPGGDELTELPLGKVTATCAKASLQAFFFFFKLKFVDTISSAMIIITKSLLTVGKWSSCWINYRKVSNIRRTLVGNKIVAHSDVVGASPVGAAPTTSSFST